MFCNKCKTEKDPSCFYSNIKSECKECTKKRVRENYRKNIKHYKEYEKKRASLPHRIKARNEYSKTDAYKASHKKAMIKYKNKYPEKRKAHIIVGNSIRNGTLKKQKCVFCGGDKASAHHEDYNKPLDVIWLCDRHHKMLHHGKIKLYTNNEFMQHDRFLL